MTAGQMYRRTEKMMLFLVFILVKMPTILTVPNNMTTNWLFRSWLLYTLLFQGYGFILFIAKLFWKLAKKKQYGCQRIYSIGLVSQLQLVELYINYISSLTGPFHQRRKRFSCVSLCLLFVHGSDLETIDFF